MTRTTLISWKVLSKMQPYCRQQIKRLEDEGKFPKRVTLGKHRVAWVLEEVEQWIAQKIKERNLP